MAEQEKFAELRGAIRAKFRTQEEFAGEMHMHPSTLSSKLNGRSQWTYEEVVTACRVLGISLADTERYFF